MKNHCEVDLDRGFYEILQYNIKMGLWFGEKLDLEPLSQHRVSDNALILKTIHAILFDILHGFIVAVNIRGSQNFRSYLLESPLLFV